jgi:hypothetical protein
LLGRVQGLKLEAREKLSSNDFGIRFVNVVFPAPGTYEFRLLADGRHLGGKKLRIREMTPEGIPGIGVVGPEGPQPSTN